MFDDLVWVGGCTSSVDEVEAMQYVVRIFKRESHLLCLGADESFRDGISAIQSLLPRIHAVHVRVESDEICIPVHSHKCDLSKGEGGDV